MVRKVTCCFFFFNEDISLFVTAQGLFQKPSTRGINFHDFTVLANVLYKCFVVKLCLVAQIFHWRVLLFFVGKLPL